jgi:hypothetical protein
MRFITPAMTTTLLACIGSSAFGACTHVGGGVITNVGVVSADRTLGVATGDLKGAIGVRVVGQSAGDYGTTVFSVEHYWVTDAGDTIFVAPAELTAFPVSPGLFAVVTYPASITGGTGRFKNAKGNINFIGEANFNTGEIGIRYSGQVCFANLLQ